MNLVKKSLYLCIGVLLALIGLQGAQSLWQVSRLADGDRRHRRQQPAVGPGAHAVGRVPRRRRSRSSRPTAFVDAASADDLRKAFADKRRAAPSSAAAVRRRPELGDGADCEAGKVEAWLCAARRRARRRRRRDRAAVLPPCSTRRTPTLDIGKSARCRGRQHRKPRPRSGRRPRWRAAPCCWTIGELVARRGAGPGAGLARAAQPAPPAGRRRRARWRAWPTRWPTAT